MKKISITVAITALLMFISPVIVSAGGYGFRNFHGTYEMISSGSCIHLEEGYVKTITPLGASLFTPINLEKYMLALPWPKARWYWSDPTDR